MDAKTDTPAAAEMVARARAMIPALRERARAGREATGASPKETIAEMQAAGLFRVLQPKRWGGFELPIATYFDIEMALAEGDMSVAWVYGVVGTHPWGLSLFDDRAANDVWGKDPSTLISLVADAVRHREAGRRRLSGRAAAGDIRAAASTAIGRFSARRSRARRAAIRIAVSS